MFQRLPLALLLALAIAGSAWAQEEITISGSVTTRSDGRAVDGAVVTIVATSVTTTSDAEGRYTVRVPESAASRERIQLRIDALGLPPKVVDVTLDRRELAVDVALTLNFT